MSNPFANFHPYVYYATRYPFSKSQTSNNRICYMNSIYLISEGKGILVTQGRQYETPPGSLVFIPAGQEHEWIADTENPMVHICCYFDWQIVDRSAYFDVSNPICYNHTELKEKLIGQSFPYPIKEFMTVERTKVWVDLFENFYTNNEYTDEKTFVRNFRIQSHFQLFIDYFLGYSMSQESDPRINKILGDLESDITRGTLKPLAHYYQALQISRGYFFEIFKKTTGFTPVQYIIHFRINIAKEDLRHSTLNISEIAEKYHFSSIHYFSRLFHKITGQTPKQFRKMNGPYPF